jgi:hypothetical protein
MKTDHSSKGLVTSVAPQNKQSLGAVAALAKTVRSKYGCTSWKQHGLTSRNAPRTTPTIRKDEWQSLARQFGVAPYLRLCKREPAPFGGYPAGKQNGLLQTTSGRAILVADCDWDSDLVRFIFARHTAPRADADPFLILSCSQA